MISFDLKCAEDHIFEIWFRSGADFEAQRDAHQINCPVCGDNNVVKAVMAPAVAGKSNRQRQAPATDRHMAIADDPQKSDRIRALVRELAKAQADALKNSAWVGDSFAEKARAMHYGDVDHAPIHGTADAQEARAMLEEGLAVAPLLVPIVPPDKLN